MHPHRMAGFRFSVANQAVKRGEDNMSCLYVPLNVIFFLATVFANQATPSQGCSLHIFTSEFIKFFMSHLDFKTKRYKDIKMTPGQLCLNFAFNLLGFHEWQLGAVSSFSWTYKTYCKTGKPEEGE